jgi:16S rRNA G966 N2-methylase RsmD
MLAEVAEVIPLIPAPAPPEDEAFLLWFDGRQLELRRSGDRKGVSVAGTEVRRRLEGDFLLGRACGISRSAPQSILDGMGGLGIDGLALAAAGNRVTIVEREAPLWAMILDLRNRVGLTEEVTVILGELSDVLAKTTEVFDVVYLDPMFVSRGKKALPGKRMQYLSALLENSGEHDAGLIERARERSHRVVLKRRLKDPVDIEPDWQIRGRAVRYDVYRGLAVAQSSRSTA